MTTTATTANRTTSAKRVSAARPGWYRGLVVAVFAAWIVVALVHPMGSGDAYEALRDEADLWLAVHFAQLLLALGLAVVLWWTVEGSSSMAATVTRLAIPVYLVFFSAFDSITGIASGLAIRHANTLNGQAQEGAGSTADYLVTNHFTADLSPIWAISSVALITAIAGAAMSLRAGGTTRVAWGFVLGGVLVSMHAGVPAAVGLASLAIGLYLSDRSTVPAAPTSAHEPELRSRATRSGPARPTPPPAAQP